MKRRNWKVRLTDRGQVLVKPLWTPSGAFAGEVVVALRKHAPAGLKDLGAAADLPKH